MPPIFSPGADASFRAVLVTLLVLPAFAVTGLMLLARSPLARQRGDPIEQPIQFDHRHHAGDEGIDCRYCHTTVEESASAGTPDIAKCMSCHAQIWNESEALRPVRDAWFSGGTIRWNKVHRLPDHVYFNHAAHVSKGVGCVTCHGRVDRMPQVMRAVDLTMSFCLDCHRRPWRHLRPLEFVADMNWQPQGDPLVLGERLAAAYNLRPRTDCTTCHR
jgi:hypothetical protein